MINWLETPVCSSLSEVWTFTEDSASWPACQSWINQYWTTHDWPFIGFFFFFFCSVISMTWLAFVFSLMTFHPSPKPSRSTVSPHSPISLVRNIIIYNTLKEKAWDWCFRVFDTWIVVWWNGFKWAVVLGNVCLSCLCCDVEVGRCLILLLGNLLMSSPLRETHHNCSVFSIIPYGWTPLGLFSTIQSCHS